jgi:NADH-quinone oxidoreductase subunit J
MLWAAAVNWHSVFFLLCGLMACLFALAVLFSSNIVRMAFYLILSLGATAGLFFLAGAHFVGAMQIMIYVGGTLVLLIFGVMLTARATFVSMKTRGGEWVLAAIVGGSLLFVLLQTAFSVEDWRRPRSDGAPLSAAESRTSAALGMGLIGARVDKLSETDEVLRRGMSGYLLPFEIVSVHLLVVLIGAAYLARAKRRIEPPDTAEPGER